MFVMQEETTYWWPVKVKQPDPERPGHWKVSTFQAQFRALPIDEAKAITTELGAGEADQHELIKRMVMNWRDVVDPSKAPIVFSDENLDRMLNQSQCRIAIYNAITESLSGEARRPGN